MRGPVICRALILVDKVRIYEGRRREEKRREKINE
jgi:hypothetical protein